MTQSERWLKNIIKVGVFATLFIPFVVTDSLYFPFITGKNFVFRIIVELLLVAWVWLALSNKRYWPKKSALLWAVLAFFGAVLVATVFSINPYKSFFSNAERMEGLFGLLHVLAFFVMTASVFNKKDWMQFFGVSLVASVGVVIHALGQGFGMFEKHQGERVDANFGNSTYLAMYAVFHFFFALYLITRIRLKEYVPFGESYGSVLQWALGVLAVLHVVVLWFTNTRGAILGLLGGLFLVALITTIFADKGRAKKIGIGALVVIILIPILFFAFRGTAFVQEAPVLGRFASISMTERTTESRITIWGMAVDAWQDKPITGWGPGNFTTVFADYYEPRLWKQEPWFDRPHNVSLQWLVSTGLLGFVAYHALFVVALIYIWKLYKRREFTALQGSLFVGLLAAYFIHNFFVFDNVVSYLLFFGVLGWLHHSYADVRRGGEPLIAGDMARKAVATLVALAMLFSLYAYNVKPIKAAGAVLDALQSMAVPQLGSENISNTRTNFERAIGMGTFMSTEAREQLVTKGTDVSQARLAGAEARRGYLDYAKAQGEEHLEQFPKDRRMRTFLASLYIQTGEFNEGEEHARVLVEVAPTRPLFWLILGEALLGQEEFGEALAAFDKAYKLAPEQPQAVEGLAMGLVRAERLGRAQAFLEEHYGTAHPPLQRIIQSYIIIEEFDDAILAAENLVEAEPEDIRWRFSLAKLYVHEFRDAAAITQLQRIIELEPRLEGQMQDLISQIRDGTINRSL